LEELTLTEINIYPIKSLGGISLKTGVIGDRGIQHDRRWMLVDKENTFITQRKWAQLALLKVALHEDHLEVFNKDHGSLKVGLNETTKIESKVTVWESTCSALEVSKDANNYFSSYLNTSIRLVYMPDSNLRYVDKNYANNNEIVGFADAFPLLLIGEGSLNDLNAKLENPIPMNRFRPNLVVNTSVPFDEDNWIEFSIGCANFKAAKPCSRCIMPTIDQNTGIKSSEPLKTLSSYRNFNNKIMFGQNLLFLGGDRNLNLNNRLIVKSRK